MDVLAAHGAGPAPLLSATAMLPLMSSQFKLDAHMLLNASLGVAWLVSLFFLLPARRRVQLEEDSAAQQAAAERAQRLAGSAVDEPQFHASMRRSRAALVTLCGCALALHLAQVIRQPPSTWQAALPHAVALALWLNMLVLSARGHSQARFANLAHLFSLACILAGVRIWDLLLPSKPRHGNPPHKGCVLFPPLEVASVALAVLAVVLSGMARVGPVREYSPLPGKERPRLMLPIGSGGASILGRLYFAHCFPVARLAWKHGYLEPSAFSLIDASNKAELLYADFKRIYVETSAARRVQLQEKMGDLRAAWPLIKALYRANASRLIVSCVLAFIGGMGFYAPSFLLNMGIREKEKSNGAEQQNQALILACVGLAAAIVVQSNILAQSWMIAMAELPQRMRAQITTSVYATALRRKNVTATSTTADGDADSSDDAFTSKAQVITLTTVDAARISEIPMSLQILLMSPAELLVGGYFSIKLLGMGAVFGFASSVMLQPLVLGIGKYIMRRTALLQKMRDQRGTQLGEALAAIRMLKFNAWEDAMSRRILRVRNDELGHQRSVWLATILNQLLFNFTPTLVTLVAYGYFTLGEGRALTPSVAFTASAVLTELRWAFLNIPLGVNQLSQALVSIARVARYLDRAEDDLVPLAPSTTLAGKVGCKEATIAWPRTGGPALSGSAASNAAFALRSISLEAVPGALNLVCGKIGAGKTLLLLGLLGECDVLDGEVACPHTPYDAIPLEGSAAKATGPWLRADRTAYMPQATFLINASLRENILFGTEWNEQRYADTLSACGLLPDLAILDDGDETEIGESGVGLSGGQKARVSLARAVYSRSQTLLLDDPLSAVDAATAAHIASELFSGRGYLMEGRTVVLVSHAVQLVAPHAAQVIVLDAGRVAYADTSDAFLRSDFYSGLIEDTDEEEAKPAHDESESSSGTSTPFEEAVTPLPTANKGASAPAKLVQEEKRARGAVRAAIYASYLQAAGGSLACAAVLGSYAAAALFALVVQYWLKDWSADVIAPLRQHSDAWWFWRWVGISSVQILLWTSRGCIYFASLAASRRLFDSLLATVLGAPMRFHETTPRGRILNRFNEDILAVDSGLVQVLDKTIEAGFVVVSSFIGVSVGSGGLTFLLATALLSPAYIILGGAYAIAARDARRLASTSTSPVVSTFSDLISGAAVVRAFGASKHGMAALMQRLDEANSYTVWVPHLQRWIGQLFMALSATAVFIASLGILLSPSVSAAQAAFALGFLINVPERLLHLIFLYANLEQKLVSVERVVEWLDEVPTEAAAEAESAKSAPPKGWPTAGAVDVSKLCVSYGPDLPLVLEDVSFAIPAGTKLGIVGATGCGKTTLATSFFRMVLPQSGSISIDSVDISQLSLHDLRSGLQIVPQDPIVLSGPLRSTVDPFEEYTDAEVLQALEAVHLIRPSTGPEESTPEHPASGGHNFADLSSEIAEGGGNLSSGQRQLLCLARAVLRRSKFIVFDEATSSVDADTDAKLQETLRQTFAESTTITIAHRIRTIVDGDLVLVMDRGHVVELAAPHELLARPDSRFYRLCRASGKAEFRHLTKMAQEAAERRS